jgi:hypothetical protein
MGAKDLAGEMSGIKLLINSQYNFINMEVQALILGI